MNQAVITTFWDSRGDRYYVQVTMPPSAEEQIHRVTMMLDDGSSVPAIVPLGSYLEFVDSSEDTSFRVMELSLSWQTTSDDLRGGTVELRQNHVPGRLEPRENIYVMHSDSTYYFVATPDVTDARFRDDHVDVDFVLSTTSWAGSLQTRDLGSCVDDP